jgi:hypothetical protein
LSPFRRAYWVGSVDARPLALFRIAFATCILIDATERLRDLRVFYTDDGVLPRALVRTLFPGSVATPAAWLMATPATAALVIAVGAAAALLLLAGVWTSVASAVVWQYLMTLQSRNAFVADGADDVMTALALWLVFADAGAAWSLRRGPRRSTVRAFPVRLLECQVMLVYLGAGVAKHGPLWRHGEALFHVLQSNDFARPLGMTLTAWPAACAALTFATLATELAFAPLVLSPWRNERTRPLAALAALAMHVGIFALMRVGMFALIMPAALCLFVPPSLLARVDGVATAAASSPSWPRAWRVGAALLALQLAVAAPAAFLSSRRLPRMLARELYRVGLTEQWQMFAPDPPSRDGYFAAEGRFVDGRAVDPLRAVTPALLPQAPFRFSRWFKLRDNLIDNTPLQMVLLDYFCRELRAPPLAQATLRRWSRPTRRPGQPPNAFAVDDERTWRCRGR